MPKEILLASLATAATQEQLDNPKFADCVMSWRDVARAINIVVPKGAKIPDISKVKFYRSDSETLRLADVIKYGMEIRNGVPAELVVVDPLVMLDKKVTTTLTLAFSKRLGRAWMATAQAIKLKEDGTGDFEFNVLRFFVAPSNIWRYVSDSLIAMPNVPFVSPVWGGYVAGYAQTGRPRVDRQKYHDVSDLNAVASFHNEELETQTSGYGILVFNPPLLNLVRR